jgi:hypothetical protein
MLHHIKKLFSIKPKAEVQPVAESAPYKVPEPAATTPIPLVVEGAGAVSVPVKTAKPKKAPAAKKAPAVKKPRAPKVPKAK